MSDGIFSQMGGIINVVDFYPYYNIVVGCGGAFL